ncbi:MAG TPA: tetratricopeptide repeat protein [Thermoanaerobaculia bacterium]|nr:tetratricopeptide repeat protein [Thermoanaerobaculia bacterium]
MKSSGFALLGCLLFAAGALAGDVVPALIEEGNAALKRKEWTAAESAYRRALDASAADTDTIWQFRAWFYLGLVKQVEAESAPDDRQRELLEKSKEPYRKALALNPSSTATLTNLAEAEWRTGNHDKAIALLEQGLALNDGRAGEFAANLGEARLHLRDRDGAMKYYAIAAEKDPENVTVHEKLLSLLLATTGPDASTDSVLTAYLGLLVARNQADRAIDAALRALETAALSAESARGVRSMLVSALAKKDYDFSGYNGSPAGTRIRALIAASSPHREALEAVELLYRGGFETTQPFGVWSDSRPLFGGSVQPSTPVTAFRELVRSVGFGLYRGQKIDAAKNYYQLALDLDPERVDPAAIRGLAAIHAARGEVAALKALDDRYDEALTALDATPAEAEDIYEFHRLAARIYSLSSAAPQGAAVRELEEAKRAGHAVEPELHAQLASMYLREGELEKSNREWLAAAEAYIREGDFRRARMAIAELGYDAGAGIDPDDYRKAVNGLVVFPSAPPISDANLPSVKRNVLLLSTPSARADRQKAHAELEALGITVDPMRSTLGFRTPEGVQKMRFVLPSRPAAGGSMRAADRD